MEGEYMKNLSFNNKKNKVLLLFTMVIGLSSCFNNLGSLKETTDPNVINGLQSVDLTYMLNTFGAGQPFRYLWDGGYYIDYTPDNETSIRTYLTDYQEIEEEFYLVYLRADVIESNREEIREMEEEYTSSSYLAENYHFGPYKDDSIIDGKHYYAFKRAKEISKDGIKYYVAKDLEDIKYQIGDFQLAMCAKRKRATILENITQNKIINKDIHIYNRYELIFKNENSFPTFYEFESPERSNQIRLNQMFQLQGLRIDAFGSEYEDKSVFSCPKIGLVNENGRACSARVIKNATRDLIVLPRYLYDPLEYEDPDLFADQIYPIPYFDVFTSHKEDFKKAFIEVSDEIYEFFQMGFYDYEQVVKIIKKRAEGAINSRKRKY